MFVSLLCPLFDAAVRVDDKLFRRAFIEETVGIHRFFIFDDRLEIYSPGSLVNSMSVESLSLRTATRNERITNLLAECSMPETFGELGRTSMMERRGDGVDIILSESEKLSGRNPEYRVLDDSEVMLTIFAAVLPNQES